MKTLTPIINSLGQQIGFSVPDWSVAHSFTRQEIKGRYCFLRRLRVDEHAEALFKAFSKEPTGKNWTYLPYGPFKKFSDFKNWLQSCEDSQDIIFYALFEKGGKAKGLASFLRISPEAGSAEIGHIHFSLDIQKTVVATEVLYLMIREIFSNGYRRCEWKCDALNSNSIKASKRLGFLFEGVFRQAIIYKRRNRDTAWFSIIDVEWKKLDHIFQTWLLAKNFDEKGRQKISLSSLTKNFRT